MSFTLNEFVLMSIDAVRKGIDRFNESEASRTSKLKAYYPEKISIETYVDGDMNVVERDGNKIVMDIYVTKYISDNQRQEII